ncbi:hypothetical protein QQP08_012760 [Theobroma cacao]|nr:hypothetical protein QQP08_012760 [Theobroma cacao]
MGVIQEKVKAFLALIAALVLRLCPKLDTTRSQSPQSQQQQPSSLPSPVIDLEISPPSTLPLRPPPSTSPSFNAESQLLNLLAAQPHLQWQSAILTFCFTFALGFSLQFSQTDQSKDKEPPFSFVLLSFAVLLIFVILLVALFISQNHARTSQVLEKVALLLAAAAFCHATAIPFPLNLKFATWTLFSVSLFVVVFVPLQFLSRASAS